MSKNVVEPGATNYVTIWRIRVACWISKTTRSHTQSHAHAPGHLRMHTQTNITLTAFRWRELLEESSTLLRYTYIACKSNTGKRYVMVQYLQQAQTAGLTTPHVSYRVVTKCRGSESYTWRLVYLSGCTDGRVKWCKRIVCTLPRDLYFVLQNKRFLRKVGHTLCFV